MAQVDHLPIYVVRRAPAPRVALAAALGGAAPHPCADVGATYRALSAGLDDAALVFWPAGSFVEFYGPQRILAERLLRLRRARLSRAGYAFAAGFPAARWGRFARRVLDTGLAVVVVARGKVVRGEPVRVLLPVPLPMTR